MRSIKTVIRENGLVVSLINAQPYSEAFLAQRFSRHKDGFLDICVGTGCSVKAAVFSCISALEILKKIHDPPASDSRSTSITSQEWL